MSDLAAPVSQAIPLVKSLRRLLELNPRAEIISGQNLNREMTPCMFKEMEKDFILSDIPKSKLHPSFISESICVHRIRLKISNTGTSNQADVLPEKLLK